MFKFSKSKFAKATSAVVTVMTVALMLGPVTASAAALSASQIQSILSLLQSFGADQATINNVSASLNGTPTTPVTPSTPGTGYQFMTDLTIGSKGADVIALQDILIAKGYLTMPAGVAKGYFGTLTQAAVSKWQAAAGITPTAGYVGPKSRAALNAMGGGSTTPTTPGTTPVAGSVSASLASDSPVAATLITGSVGTIAKFVITNGNSSAVKVTGVKLTRTGVSSDSTLNNVYLYNGAQRLTDAASISLGKINFSDTAGVVTVPAMGSVTISVRVEVASGTNGQTVGVMLTDVMTDATGATTGLPVSASQHNIATAPSGMTTVDFTGTVTPAAASVDPQDDYTVWQANINVGNRDAIMKSIRFRQIGSVLPGDLANFRLMVDGAQVGTAVAALDSLGYVTFDLMAAPKTLTSGTRVVKLVANIVSGSGRNFKFSLRQASDLQVADSQLGVDLLPTVSSSSFTARESGQQDVNAGVLTITKETDSPSGNVTNQASNITLAKFKFKAQGERIKVENLVVGHSSTTASLRNGSIVANGTQIGSVSPIAAAGTTINLGSSLIVEPGKDVIVEIKGDIYTVSHGPFANGSTLTVSLNAGSSNAQRLVKLDYVNAPATAVSGNQLTVAAGSMTLSKYTAFANQTLVVPQTAVKIGEYRLQSGSTEDVNLNTLTVGVNSTTTSAITDLYVMYGTKTTPVKASVSSSNAWSINELLPKNTTLEVKVYATLATTFTGQASTTAQVDGNAVSSGSSVTSGTVVGQTISSGTGAISVATDASTPVSATVVGGAMPKVASFKFTSTNDSFTVTELYASTTGTGSAVIGSLIWKDGATTIATTPFSGAYATTTGLSLAVPANSTKVIDAYLQLATVGTPGAAASGLNVQIGLDGYKYRNSNGVETAVEAAATDVIGNAMYVYKTKPTISNVALPSTTLSATTLTVAKFTISADSAGTIAWRKITLNISSSTPSGSFNVGSYNIYDAANESTALANVTVSGGSTTTVTFLSSQDQEVSGSKTYVVKATVAGSGAGQTGATLSHSIATGQTAYAAPSDYASVPGTSSFIWSDESVTPHSASAASWNGDFLVKNIPTDSQTLTK